jgi:hypothetical protein
VSAAAAHCSQRRKTHKPERAPFMAIIRQVLQNVPLQEAGRRENLYGQDFERRTDGGTVQGATAKTENTGGLRGFSPYSRYLRDLSRYL